MKLLKNSIYNLVGSLVPLGITLVTLPLFVGFVGEAKYGALAIFWVILGYFGLVDLGVGRVVAQRLASNSLTEIGEKQLLHTGVFIALALGVTVSGLAYVIMNLYFENFLVIERVEPRELNQATLYALIGIPIISLSGFLNGILLGRQRFRTLNVLSIFGSVLFQCLPLIAASQVSTSLDVLVAFAIVARIISCLLLMAVCWNEIHFVNGLKASRRAFKVYLSSGGWYTLSSTIGPLMVSLDRLVIGSIDGASKVAHYSIPFNLGERSVVIARSFAGALFPDLASKSSEQRTRSAAEAALVNLSLTLPVAVTAIVLVEPFLAWWITDSFAEKTHWAAQFILVGWWINGVAQVAFVKLQADDRPGTIAKCHLVEVIPYLLLLFICVDKLGIIGAAIAFSMRTTVDLFLLSYYGGILRHIFWPFVLALVLVLVAMVLHIDHSLVISRLWLLISLIILALSFGRGSVLALAWSRRSAIKSYLAGSE